MWLDNLNSELRREFTAMDLEFDWTVRLRDRYFIGGGQIYVSSYSYAIKAGTMGLLYSGMMDVTCGTVTTLRGGSKVVHETTLVGAVGRGSLGYIVGVTVGCGGVMASRKITVSCEMASSLRLDNFEKGSGGWGFCRAMANSSKIMMAQLTDDSKGVLEKS